MQKRSQPTSQASGGERSGGTGDQSEITVSSAVRSDRQERTTPTRATASTPGTTRRTQSAVRMRSGTAYHEARTNGLMTARPLSQRDVPPSACRHIQPNRKRRRRRPQRRGPKATPPRPHLHDPWAAHRSRSCSGTPSCCHRPSPSTQRGRAPTSGVRWPAKTNHRLPAPDTPALTASPVRPIRFVVTGAATGPTCGVHEFPSHQRRRPGHQGSGCQLGGVLVTRPLWVPPLPEPAEGFLRVARARHRAAAEDPSGSDGAELWEVTTGGSRGSKNASLLPRGFPGIESSTRCANSRIRRQSSPSAIASSVHLSGCCPDIGFEQRIDLGHRAVGPPP